MEFRFSDEEEALRRALRRFLEQHAASKAVRAAAETDQGVDEKLWQRLAEELGLQGLLVPEAYGGAGLGDVELVAVTEELGRSLACVPYFSTVALALPLVVEGASEAVRERWLPGIADGSTTATWVSPALHPAHASVVSITAEPTAGGLRLRGRARHVVDGHVAKLLVIEAVRPSGERVLCVCDAEREGVTRRQTPVMDRTRRAAEIELADVRVTDEEVLVGGDPAESARLADRAFDRACVALASEQVGGAERCLEMAVDYAKTRVQFGRAIGSFQAIKHKCADMFTAVESARSAVLYAAWAVTGEPADLPHAASTAKAAASEAFFLAAAENIQIHGGTGFTWEHDAHLWFKRARAGESLLGGPAWHRERFAKLFGIGVAV